MKKNRPLKEVKKPELPETECEEEVIDIDQPLPQKETVEETAPLKTGKLTDLELRELEAMDHRIEQAKLKREIFALKRDNALLSVKLFQKESEIAMIKSAQMEAQVSQGKTEVDRLWEEKKKMAEEISKRYGITGGWKYDDQTGEFESKPA